MVDTGKVVRFDEVRGYGFVSPDIGGEDLFVHVNDLEIDKRLIVPGVRVEFVAEEGDRGLKASHVRLNDKPTATVPPVMATAQPEAGHLDEEDDLCDVLTVGQLTSELTEVLLAAVHSLSAHQILAVREHVVILAREHGWIAD